jgi:leucyl aminopeptidase (aminopeptidase T)
VQPADEKCKRFSQEQEAARKDVERAFGVLQLSWAIVRYPNRTWSLERMWNVMTACVIMHNMIVENERDDSIYVQGWDFQSELAELAPGVAS